MHRRHALCLIGLFFLTASVYGQDVTASPSGTDPARAELYRLIQRYRRINTYQATGQFVRQEKLGRLTSTVSGDYRIALDRSASRLLIDHAEYLLVIDSGKLRFHHYGLPDRYLELTAPDVLEARSINRLVPLVKFSELPDASLLLAGEPEQSPALSNAVITTGQNDQGQRLLILTLPAQPSMTLQVDPTQDLVVESRWEAISGSADPPQPFHLTTCRLQPERVDQPVDPTVFVFDLGRAQAVDSLDKLFAFPPRREGLTIGTPVEDFELPRLDGSIYRWAEESSQVVVLDFWATWCSPCREGLPELQELSRWAHQAGKSVAVYAINLQEDPQRVRDFLEKRKLDLVVLLDQERKLAEKFGVQAIPYIVITANRKVTAVHIGLTDQVTLRRDVERALEQAAQDQPADMPAKSPPAP